MNEMKSIEKDEVLVRSPAKRRRRIALMLAVPAVIVAVGLFLWLTSGRTVSTDNAYVKQDVTAISTQVNGPVSKVFVRENQMVKRGDPLFEIDPAPYRAALDAAEAQLAAARLQTRQLSVQSSGTKGDIVAGEANLAIARRALDRQKALLADGFTTRSNYDDAVNEVAKAEAQLADARARSANAAAALAPGGDQPAIAAALAAVEKAKLDLKHTVVHAPVSGRIAKADRLLVGQTGITGVSMLSIVGGKPAWVEANFKEGDLARMAPGLKATVKFDAYPDLKLPAHVASIGSGTGSEFSVLPAQNANGNWVKVTQRVPVRLEFDQKPPRAMIAGLSAEVEVKLNR